MGRDKRKWGSEDHWTFTPHKMARGAGGARREGRDAAATVIPGAASTLTLGGGRGGGRGRRRRRRRRRRQADRSAPRGADDEGTARSARLHPAVRSAGLRDGGEVRQHADQDRHHDSSRDGAVHGERQDVSGELAHRQDGAGVPAARHGHVRAAGSSGRHSVPGRRADAAVRLDRLHARVHDGREVRSHPRRLRRAVRRADGLCESAGRRNSVEAGVRRRSATTSAIR